MRMRMLLAIAGLAMTMPGLARAQDTDGSVNPNEPGSMGGVSPGPEHRTGMGTGQMPGGQAEQQIFHSKENFDLKGTVASVDPSSNKITIDRPNLPPAELMTSNQTKVKVNGRQASLNDLMPGAEVRAKFNLAQDQAVATEVDAKSKATKEMQKGAHEMQKGAREMERGAQQNMRHQ